MPLQQIAHQILTLADRRASTPVLVTPPYLSFRKQFFVELTREIANHTERDLRVDWYRGLPGVRTILTDQLASWHVKSVNRLLRRVSAGKAKQPTQGLGNQQPMDSLVLPESTGYQNPASDRRPTARPQIATIQITAAIARPGGKSRDLVIGLSDVRQRLPDWTTAIWLGTSAQEVKHWQAA
jgi:hypothetical protein